MSNDAAFCRRQAMIQRGVADAATLDNVRLQSERAAASWDAMASRAERTERLRADGAEVLIETARMWHPVLRHAQHERVAGDG